MLSIHCLCHGTLRCSEQEAGQSSSTHNRAANESRQNHFLCGPAFRSALRIVAADLGLGPHHGSSTDDMPTKRLGRDHMAHSGDMCSSPCGNGFGIADLVRLIILQLLVALADVSLASLQSACSPYSPRSDGLSRLISSAPERSATTCRVVQRQAENTCLHRPSRCVNRRNVDRRNANVGSKVPSRHLNASWSTAPQTVISAFP